MLKQDSASNSTASGATMPAATACGNCGMEERRLLHNVRHRGIFRRLCTSCVLRLHAQSFCPTCFTVYHPSPPPSGPNDAVTCFKCYSSSHLSCAGPNPPSPYVCPICVSPNSPIFALKKAKDLNFSGGNGVNDENCRVIDKKAAKILLAAAKIAAVSMSKAALAARAEAERRAKEAAVTRRRAREALEHVMVLAAKEKMKTNEAPLTSSGEVSRSGGVVGVVNARHGNLSGAMVARVGALAGRQRVNNVERMDSSNEVVAALNKVELREKEKLEGTKSQSVASGQPSSNGVAMDVDGNNGARVASSSNIIGSTPQDHNNGVTGHLGNQNAQGEKFNGVVPVPVPANNNPMQGVENSHSGDRENNNPQQ